MNNSMKQSILDFPKQLLWKPEIENQKNLPKQKIIIAGMGGSALAGGFLKMLIPQINIRIHRNYGLPYGTNKDTLVVAISYSGNTEETIDALETARKNKTALAVIATGGRLLHLAKQLRIPYIEIPNIGIQPRMATGFILKALAHLVNEKSLERNLEKTGRSIKPTNLAQRGTELARKLKNSVPIIYSSEANKSIARTLKIKFNETGKIPAFYNVLPELNHNEMTGYDSNQKTRALSKNFAFILLQDKNDAPRIKKRMSVLKKILEQKKLQTLTIPFTSRFLQSIFETILIGDWAAYYLAKIHGADSENVPLVEKFKKLIA